MPIDATDPDDQSRWTRNRALIMLGVVIFLAYFVLGRFDDTTELTPDHSDVLTACFWIGGFGALVAALIVISRWKKLASAQKIVWPFCAAILGFLITFMPSSTIADLVENHIDFPADKTQTFQGLIAISRAYQTHGKSRSWNIQTKPLWSNMEISQSDYKFMLSHRSPNDHGRDPDEVSSEGFFCAKVTAQRAGDAIRILHAGREKLPEGTVILCPPRQGQ